jgi:hypothetical protein
MTKQIKMLSQAKKSNLRLKFIHVLRTEDYESKLTLKARKKRGDLIQMLQMYKARNNLEDSDWNTSTPRYAPMTQTRAASNNNYRLEMKTFQVKAQNYFCHFVSVRHEFFLNRTSIGWNSLTNHQINSPNLNVFKARIYNSSGICC